MSTGDVRPLTAVYPVTSRAEGVGERTWADGRFLRDVAMPPLYPRISDLSNRDGSSGNAFDVRRTPRVSCSHSHGSTLDRVLLPPALTLRTGTALGRMEGAPRTPVPARPQPSTLAPQPFSGSNTGPIPGPPCDNRTHLTDGE